MQIRPILAATLVLTSVAAYSQSDEEDQAPPETPGVEIPLSAFEAIQTPPPAGLPSVDPAAPPPPLRLQIDPHLSATGPATPPPPLTPAQRPDAPSPPPAPERD